MIYRKYNFIVLFCNTSNLSIPYTSTRAFQKTKGKEERRVRSLFCPLSFFRFKGRTAASPVVNPIPWIQRKGEKGFFCLESHRKTWNYCWRMHWIKLKNEGNFPGYLHVEQIWSIKVKICGVISIPSFVLMASSNVSSLNHVKCLRANWRIEKAEDDECLDSKKRHQRILLLRSGHTYVKRISWISETKQAKSHDQSWFMLHWSNNLNHAAFQIAQIFSLFSWVGWGEGGLKLTLGPPWLLRKGGHGEIRHFLPPPLIEH